MLKTEVEKELRSLDAKWKPLIDYLERNGKEPDEALEAFMKLEDIVHSWSKKDANVTTDSLEVIELETLTRKKPFHYEGSVEKGTTILFGQNKYAIITADQYKELLNHFKGKTVSIGTSFTTPPSDSIGAWLLEHVSKRALASYVAPILIKEGYATLYGDSKSDLVITASVV